MGTVALLDTRFYEGNAPSSFIKSYEGEAGRFGLIGCHTVDTVTRYCTLRFKFSNDAALSGLRLSLKTCGANQAQGFAVAVYISDEPEEYINRTGTAGSFARFTVGAEKDYEVEIPCEVLPGTHYLFLVPARGIGYNADVFAEGSSLGGSFLSVPSIMNEQAFRCDSSGTADENGLFISVRADVVWTAEEGSAALSCSYKVPGGVDCSPISLQSGIPRIIGGSLSPDSSLLVSLRLAYSSGGATKYKTASVTIPTRLWAFHIREGGRGAAFGKTAEADYELQLPPGWSIRLGGTALSEQLLIALLRAAEEGSSGS